MACTARQLSVPDFQLHRGNRRTYLTCVLASLIHTVHDAYRGTFVNGLKTQMLNHLDGIESRDKKVVVIGATNKLSSIDKAMRRRMRLHIEVPLPDYDARVAILKQYLDDDKIVNSFARISGTCSGSDLFEICKY